ncbi:MULTISPECIES: nucleoside triphosphate pyrophosphatase [unclassified Moraxella]|uniref:Maf family protein n=1 Tax=unclassified Moraxella TaxID=2685852 RepID=UPI00359E9C44
MRVILASTSPRRQELLRVAGVDFDIMNAPIDESCYDNERATDYAMRMVHAKADRAIELMGDDEALIITADTIGVLEDGQVLTKPTDKDDAFAMWAKLSGATHEIWTAVCVSGIQGGRLTARQSMICRTQVHFVKLSNQMMVRYWQTGEPADKAGAYAIQGGAMAWIKEINGSYTNVVGLPLAQTLELMTQVVDMMKTDCTN